MPELPEVETTLRGIEPHISQQTINKVIVRQTKLRWLIPDNLNQILAGETVKHCQRRAKYLLIQFTTGVLIIHLGMSGSLRIFRQPIPEAQKHDHVDFIFNNGTCLRYHDPRKFGAILWYAGVAEHHHLLKNLGIEPLERQFNARYLHHKLSKQTRAIKLAIMDNAIVVGIGNIYANESLFQAGISPQKPAQSLTLDECKQLVTAIKLILKKAIQAGGSTLKDFVDSEGKSGYFQQQYHVYGRHHQPCHQCGQPIHKITLGQRGTFYCPICQPIDAVAEA